MVGQGEWVVWVLLGLIVLFTWGAYVAGARHGLERLERRALRRALCVEVRDVMSRPVVVGRETTSLEEAASIMKGRRIGCLPVVGAQGELIGVVTESDLTGVRVPLPQISWRGSAVGDRIRAFGAEEGYEEARAITLGEVMTRRVVTATEEEPVSDVVVRMMDRRLRHLPVVRDGVPVGVVARHDLLDLLATRCR